MLPSMILVYILLKLSESLCKGHTGLASLCILASVSYISP